MYGKARRAPGCRNIWNIAACYISYYERIARKRLPPQNPPWYHSQAIIPRPLGPVAYPGIWTKALRRLCRGWRRQVTSSSFVSSSSQTSADDCQNRLLPCLTPQSTSCKEPPPRECNGGRGLGQLILRGTIVNRIILLVKMVNYTWYRFLCIP